MQLYGGTVDVSLENVTYMRKDKIENYDSASVLYLVCRFISREVLYHRSAPLSRRLGGEVKG